MGPVSAIILIVLVLVVGFGPRRWALLGMTAGVFFLTQGHSVNVAGLTLYPVRFLELAACGRVLLRGELRWSRLNRLDATLLFFYNFAAAVAILRSPSITPKEFANAVDPTLCYLALRGLIGELEDVEWLLRALAILLIPYTALVLTERLTGQSAFRLVGANWNLYFRSGAPRCQGSFRHAVLLGSVAASFLALFIGVWAGGSRRAGPALGALLCLTLVVLSRSGGPLTSTGAVVLGWALWVLRRRMRLVRWAGVGTLALLALVMKAPIWYLPSKISAIVGGSGWHRGLLMEQAWNQLDRWWLVGMDVSGTAEWIPYQHGDFVGADITNQFVVFGLRGGLLALLLSIAVLALAFKALGTSMASVRDSNGKGRSHELLLWGLGVALFVHAVSWLGVSYFDQSYAIWLLHLAAVSAPVVVGDPRNAALSRMRPDHPPGRGPRRSVHPRRAPRTPFPGDRAFRTR